jgi:hypothetical protein
MEQDDRRKVDVPGKIRTSLNRIDCVGQWREYGETAPYILFLMLFGLD